MPGVFGDHGALAVAVFSCGEHRLRLALCNQHRDHVLAFLEHHASHAARRAPHRPHIVFVETNRLARVRKHHHVVRTIGHRRADQVITLIEIDGDDAGLPRVGKIGQRGFLDRAQARAHEHIVGLVKAPHRQHDGDLLAFG